MNFKHEKMKKIILPFLIIAFVSSAINAQTVFQKVYPNIYEGTSIQQTTDGGYIIAGGYNAYLLKLNSSGNTVWNKTYGDSSYIFNSVQQTADGGYIAAGATNYSYSSTSDVYLVRTNSTGDTLWTKSYGGTSYANANSVKQTPDGGFIVAGSYSFGAGGDAYLIKTDANGNLLWTKIFLSGGFGSANEIQNTNDGGFIITGSYYNFVIYLKTDSIGDTLWSKYFEENYGLSNGIGKSVVQTSDGGYIVLGNTNDAMGHLSTLIKLNSNGDTTWTKTLYFQEGDNYLNSIKQTPDGGYIIAGSAKTESSPYSGALALLIKTDMNGDTLWTKKYEDESQYSASYIYDVERTNEGGYVMIGHTNCWGGGTYLIKTDSLGNTTCDNGFAKFSYVNFPIAIYSGATPLGSGGVANNVATIIGIADTTYINPCLLVPGICMVTVDSATQKNMVIWEKNIDTSFVDSYNIYRETTSSGVYSKIGNVPNNILSTFIDYASIPAQKANRYEITTVDSHGIESYSKSAAHKTIHLSVNLGIPPQINLIWDNYEGFTVNTYRIWRGNAGGMSLMDSVAGTMFSYTDLTPPANDTIYFIEALKPSGGCIPTIKSYSSTKSNFVNTKNPTDIIEHLTNTTFSIYPNPFNISTTIYLKNDNQHKQFYFILYDLCGRAVRTIKLKNETTILSGGNLKNGMYFYKIFNDSGILKTGKLIVQ